MSRGQNHLATGSQGTDKGLPHPSPRDLCLSPSIQVKIGCVWDATYGSLGRNMQEFHLSSGEHITAVHGKHLLKLWMLNVCTNHNHCVQFGKSVGKPFSAFPSEDGEVLQGFFGFLALNGFKNIGFKWGILPPESLPAPTCNNTLQ